MCVCDCMCVSLWLCGRECVFFLLGQCVCYLGEGGVSLCVYLCVLAGGCVFVRVCLWGAACVCMRTVLVSEFQVVKPAAE